MKNREAKRTFKVNWNITDLENTSHLKYLCVALDGTQSYKEHIPNSKMTVATRNNLLKKLSNSKWGYNARTIRTTAVTLSYSAVKYTYPVWDRSSHASKLNPELNDTCRSITGCLRSIYVEELYMFAGVAPLDIRKDVCATVKSKKQKTRAVHFLNGQVPE